MDHENNDPIDQYEDLMDPLTGKVIKSAFGTDFYRNAFNGVKKPRPNAINLTILGDSDHGNALHAYLNKVGVEAKNVVCFDKLTKKSYIIEFRNLTWRRYLCND